MVVRTSSRFHNQKLLFKKNGENHIEIPRDNAIRQIMMKVTITIKTPAGQTPASARKEYHALNLIKKFKLIRDGHDTKISLSGVSKYLMDWADIGVKPTESAVPAAPAAGSSTEYVVYFVWDFAQNRKSMSDLSALLGTQNLSSLNFYIEWQDIKAIFGTPGGSEIDEDKTYAEFTLVEAYDAPGEGASLSSYLGNALDIREIEHTPYELVDERTSFDLDETVIDVKPTPATTLFELWRVLKNVTDGSPTHADDVITHFKFANIKGRGESIWRDTYDKAHALVKQLFSLDSLPAGILAFNWRDLRQGGFVSNTPEAIKIKLLHKAAQSGKKNNLIIAKRFIVTGNLQRA